MAFLRAELEARNEELRRREEEHREELRRKDHIIAGLVERVPELEAPDEMPARPRANEEPAQDAANGAAGPAPPAGDAGAQNGSGRVSWWRRVFGG
ncbi:MAG: hypothetical protein H0X71_11795 [Rubrobacter sp.]|nr:hypothetical protein [Rubrobacter sp.]